MPELEFHEVMGVDKDNNIAFVWNSMQDGYLWIAIIDSQQIVNTWCRPVKCSVLSSVLELSGFDHSSARWGQSNSHNPEYNAYCKEVTPMALKQSVYFIQAIGGGPIKIGIAIDVLGRLAQIQRMSPCELQILASEVGGHEKEAELHRRFAPYRLHGEWFEANENLLGYIAGVRM